MTDKQEKLAKLLEEIEDRESRELLERMLAETDAEIDHLETRLREQNVELTLLEFRAKNAEKRASDLGRLAMKQNRMITVLGLSVAALIIALTWGICA